MVATHYRSINKYLRELQLHPAIEYLLQCFVVPSSVVLVWNQVSRAIREEGELKEMDRSGCEMEREMGMCRLDLSSIEIEWSGESTGNLIPCFHMEPLPPNEYWVITSLVSSEEAPEENPNDAPPGKPSHQTIDRSVISRHRGHWPSFEESESFSEMSEGQGHIRTRSVLEEGTRPVRYYYVCL